MTEKKEFEFKQVFSARLKEEYRNYLNDNKIDLIPEDTPEGDLTCADVLIHMAEKALSKSINQKEYSSLKKENGELNQLQVQNVQNAERLQQSVDSLQTENKSLQESVNSLQSVNNELQTKLDEVSAQYYDLLEISKDQENKLLNTKSKLPKENELVIPIDPVELIVVNTFVNKFTELAQKPVNASQLIWDLFWRYIYKQETQLAFPFVLTPREIDSIIAENKKEE